MVISATEKRQGRVVVSAGVELRNTVSHRAVRKASGKGGLGADS